MSESAVVEAPAPVQEKPKRKRQPPYAVIVENDEFHTFDYVIETLQKVFGYETQKCEKLAMTVHKEGEAQVWSGTLEHAELKRDQIRGAGPDLYAEKTVKFPLGVRLEPLK